MLLHPPFPNNNFHASRIATQTHGQKGSIKLSQLYNPESVLQYSLNTKGLFKSRCKYKRRITERYHDLEIFLAAIHAHTLKQNRESRLKIVGGKYA